MCTETHIPYDRLKVKFSNYSKMEVIQKYVFAYAALVCVRPPAEQKRCCFGVVPVICLAAITILTRSQLGRWVRLLILNVS